MVFFKKNGGPANLFRGPANLPEGVSSFKVYDGGSTSAQKIGDKYGSESGEDIGTLISSGKQMTLTFHSAPSDSSRRP